jgi:outer membrane beta-barrel protein
MNEARAVVSKLNFRRLGIVAKLLCGALATFCYAPASFSQQPGSSQPGKSSQVQVPGKLSEPIGSDEKVDVTDLEKKYWAAKDTDFSVVQNRLYSKAGRFALTGQYGYLINDQWSDGPTVSGSLGYYFSERLGVEGHLQVTRSVDNRALNNLRAQSGTANHGKIVGYQGLTLNWVPFYAKMSLLNSSIIYFDMAISPGLGFTSYDQQRETGNIQKNAPTVALDITQSFFFSKYSAVRVDFKNRWFQEEIVRFRSPSTSVNTETAQTSILMFGLTFYY